MLRDVAVGRFATPSSKAVSKVTDERGEGRTVGRKWHRGNGRPASSVSNILLKSPIDVTVWRKTYIVSLSSFGRGLSIVRLPRPSLLLLLLLGREQVCGVRRGFLAAARKSPSLRLTR